MRVYKVILYKRALGPGSLKKKKNEQRNMEEAEVTRPKCGFIKLLYKRALGPGKIL